MSIELIFPIMFASVALLLLIQHKRAQNDMQAQRKADLERISNLEHELNALSNAAIGVGRKALQQDSIITALESKIEEIQLNDPSSVSYAEASRLVDMGASIEELMTSCHISRPEAELIQTMTRHKSRTQPAAEEEIPLLREQV